jgi:hypothetical protein
MIDTFMDHKDHFFSLNICLKSLLTPNMALVVQRQPIFTPHGEGRTQRKSPDASNASSSTKKKATRGYTATTSA